MGRFSFALTIAFLIPILILSPLTGAIQEPGEVYKQLWAGEINSYINSETLYIVINNLLVAVMLSSFSILPFSMFFKEAEEGKSYKYSIGIDLLTKVVVTSYILYFFKEGVRIGLMLLDFPYKSYFFRFLTLILPHGILEIAGLTLLSSAAFYYFKEQTVQWRSFYMYALGGAGMIIVAGVLETTITPYVFKSFL